MGHETGGRAWERGHPARSWKMIVALFALSSTFDIFKSGHHAIAPGECAERCPLSQIARARPIEAFMPDFRIERLLARDRWIVGTCLALITVLAWIWRCWCILAPFRQWPWPWETSTSAAPC